jgi:hypothetical protein
VNSGETVREVHRKRGYIEEGQNPSWHLDGHGQELALPAAKAASIVMGDNQSARESR